MMCRNDKSGVGPRWKYNKRNNAREAANTYYGYIKYKLFPLLRGQVGDKGHRFLGSFREIQTHSSLLTPTITPTRYLHLLTLLYFLCIGVHGEIPYSLSFVSERKITLLKAVHTLDVDDKYARYN